MPKKRCSDYAKEIADELNMEEKAISKILSFGMGNVVKCMLQRQDVTLPGFGHIYKDKRPYKNGKREKTYRPKSKGPGTGTI